MRRNTVITFQTIVFQLALYYLYIVPDYIKCITLYALLSSMMVRIMVFNATFNYISVISWGSVLLEFLLYYHYYNIYCYLKLVVLFNLILRGFIC
jgi:hypothetical protein